jgi:hypothetical protein
LVAAPLVHASGAFVFILDLMLTEMYIGVKHFVNKKYENKNGQAKTSEGDGQRGVVRRQGGEQ